MNRLYVYFIAIFVLIIGVFVSSCSDSNEKGQVVEFSSPKLNSMKFTVQNNLYQLIEDVECEIIGDSIVECWIKHLLPTKELVANFDFSGESVKLNGMTAQSGITRCDYSKPATLTISDGEINKEYVVYVHTFTGLPVVWIETEDRKEIESKIEYVNASFKLEENVITRAAGDIFEAKVQIKGRGNSSWAVSPKKSYRLKFDEKISLFDEPKDKAWVMIANYFDKTMIRNHIAFYLGKKSCLDYTPNFHFVELMLNGSYMGTYMLGDKLKISKSRVNVGDDGFLLEIDERATNPDESDPYFRTEHLEQPVSIKDPEVQIDDENYNYIKDFVTSAESALFADNFRDEKAGWRKYFDEESLVDWFIIHEIARNYDPLFLFTSCYINLKRGGKLKMGPIWDFDVTFGNNQNPLLYPIEGMAGERSSWFHRLIEDAEFRNQVKSRYEYFYSLKDDILEEIDSSAIYLKYSVDENNNKWEVLYNIGFGNHNAWGNYQNEIQCLKEWIVKRMDWLKVEFSKYN